MQEDAAATCGRYHTQAHFKGAMSAYFPHAVQVSREARKVSKSGDGATKHLVHAKCPHAGFKRVRKDSEGATRPQRAARVNARAKVRGR